MTPTEQKTARLTVLIDPAKKRAFEALCAAQDVTPSQVVRKLIREYLQQHGVQWAPARDADDTDRRASPTDKRP
ncbi:MAG: CopG family transcriptional regulator [Burkholderiaceae bacterium]